MRIPFRAAGVFAAELIEIPFPTAGLYRYDGLIEEKLSSKRDGQSGMLLGMDVGGSTVPQ